MKSTKSTKSNKSSQFMIQTFIESKRQMIHPNLIAPSDVQEIQDDPGSEDQIFEKVSDDLDDDIKNCDFENIKNCDLDSYSSSPNQIHSEQRPLSLESDKVMIDDKQQKFRSLKTTYQGGWTNQTWRKSPLVVVCFVSKFILSLKQQSGTFKFRRLSRKVFELLNDRTSDYDFFLITKQIKVNMSKLGFTYLRLSRFWEKHMDIQNFNAIEPDGYFKIIWDIIMMFITVLNIFYVPTKLAFDIQLPDNSLAYYLLDQIPSWVFLFDIAINFNTAFYDEGKINSNRRSIVINYIKGDLLFDVVVITVFFISKLSIPYIDFILMLRITRVSKIFENVEEALNLRERYATIIDLLKLIYLVVFVGHFCACAWYYLAHYEDGNSWLVVRHLTDASTSTKYIQSLYWSVITLLTVGYGDITPVTDIEMLFVIIMTLITCGVFGYAINSIGSIFKEMELKKDKIRNQMSTINSHMRKNNINKHLQLKVRKYFEYYYQRNDDQEEKVSQLMNVLAPDLRNDFLIEMYEKTLKKSQLLNNNLTDQCLKSLCQFVKEQRLSPGEMVIQKGQQINRLYFILNGKLSIFFLQKNLYPNQSSQSSQSSQTSQSSQKKQKKQQQATEIQSNNIRYLKEGYVLGEKNFLLQTEMNYQASAAGFSTIAYISYEDFISCIQQYPDDYEKLCLLKDKLLYKELFKKVFTLCEICGSNHAFNKCPYPFFQCNRSKVLYVENQSKPQERQQFNRSTRHSNIQRSIIQQAGLAICLNEDLINEDELNDDYLAQLGFGQNSTMEDQQQTLFNDESFELQMQKSSQFVPKKKNPHSHIDDLKEANVVQSTDRILRFENLDSSDNPEKDRNYSTGNPSYNAKKGILKKSTFIIPQNMEFEYGSVSDFSELAPSARKSSNNLRIARTRQRHQKLTIKYDRATQFLNQLVSYKSIMSQKSFNDTDGTAMKQSYNMKQSSNMKQSINIRPKQIGFESKTMTQTDTDQPLENNNKTTITQEIKEEAIDNFDKNKAYHNYFPQYNLDVVLESLNQQKLKKNQQNNSVHSTHLHRQIDIGTLAKKKLVSTYFQQKRLNKVKSEEK